MPDFSLILMLFGVAHVSGDLYLHVPRGSNNRLKENSANRANANRLFDSQVSLLSQRMTPLEVSDQLC